MVAPLALQSALQLLSLLNRPGNAVRSGLVHGPGAILPGLRGEVETDPTELPGIRDLPDQGPQIGPIHATPKTIGGFAAGLALDPLSYVPVAGIAGKAGGRVGGEFGARLAEQAATGAFHGAGGLQGAALAGFDTDTGEFNPGKAALGFAAGLAAPRLGEAMLKPALGAMATGAAMHGIGNGAVDHSSMALAAGMAKDFHAEYLARQAERQHQGGVYQAVNRIADQRAQTGRTLPPEDLDYILQEVAHPTNPDASKALTWLPRPEPQELTQRLSGAAKNVRFYDPKTNYEQITPDSILQGLKERGERIPIPESGRSEIPGDTYPGASGPDGAEIADLPVRRPEDITTLKQQHQEILGRLELAEGDLQRFEESYHRDVGQPGSWVMQNPAKARDFLQQLQGRVDQWRERAESGPEAQAIGDRLQEYKDKLYQDARSEPGAMEAHLREQRGNRLTSSWLTRNIDRLSGDESVDPRDFVKYNANLDEETNNGHNYGEPLREDYPADAPIRYRRVPNSKPLPGMPEPEVTDLDRQGTGRYRFELDPEGEYYSVLPYKKQMELGLRGVNEASSKPQDARINRQPILDADGQPQRYINEDGSPGGIKKDQGYPIDIPGIPGQEGSREVDVRFLPGRKAASVVSSSRRIQGVAVDREQLDPEELRGSFPSDPPEGRDPTITAAINQSVDSSLYAALEDTFAKKTKMFVDSHSNPYDKLMLREHLRGTGVTKRRGLDNPDEQRTYDDELHSGDDIRDTETDGLQNRYDPLYENAPSKVQGKPGVYTRNQRYGVSQREFLAQDENGYRDDDYYAAHPQEQRDDYRDYSEKRDNPRIEDVVGRPEDYDNPLEYKKALTNFARKYPVSQSDMDIMRDAFRDKSLLESQYGEDEPPPSHMRSFTPRSAGMDSTERRTGQLENIVGVLTDELSRLPASERGRAQEELAKYTDLLRARPAEHLTGPLRELMSRPDALPARQVPGASADVPMWRDKRGPEIQDPRLETRTAVDAVAPPELTGDQQREALIRRMGMLDRLRQAGPQMSDEELQRAGLGDMVKSRKMLEDMKRRLGL